MKFFGRYVRLVHVLNGTSCCYSVTISSLLLSVIGSLSCENISIPLYSSFILYTVYLISRILLLLLFCFFSVILYERLRVYFTTVPFNHFFYFKETSDRIRHSLTTLTSSFLPIVQALFFISKYFHPHYNY